MWNNREATGMSGTRDRTERSGAEREDNSDVETIGFRCSDSCRCSGRSDVLDVVAWSARGAMWRVYVVQLVGEKRGVYCRSTTAVRL